MNLFFRLFWLALVGGRRPPVPALGPCRTPFRVMPTDLDVLLHVNNGVYLSLMDLARVDLMRRAGLVGVLRSNGWYPVVAAETIQFRRSLRAFQRFAIETRVLTWDERSFLIEQRFESGGEIVARALVRAQFLRRRGGGRVPPAELFAAAGLPTEPAPADVPDAAARWYADHATWPAAADGSTGPA